MKLHNLHILARLPYFPAQKEQKYIVELFLSLSRSSEIKFHCCVTSDVWYGHKS